MSPEGGVFYSRQALHGTRTGIKFASYFGRFTSTSCSCSFYYFYGVFLRFLKEGVSLASRVLKFLPRGKSLPKIAYEISDFCDLQKSFVILVISADFCDFCDFR